MTVVDDVKSKCSEIEVKTTFIKTLGGKANDTLWLPGDAGYAYFKTIADVQVVLLETLAGELQALTAP